MDTPRGLKGRRSQSLTLAEATALLEAAESSRLHAFIVLCLLPGFGRGGTGADVGARGPGGGDDLGMAVGAAHGDTKTNRSRRTLKLPGIAVEALRGQGSARLRSGPRLGSYGGTGLVFTTSVGTAYESHNLRRDFRRVTAAAGWAPGGCRRNCGRRSSA